MIRFLTPSKIGLLALIDLYTDSAVPNDAIIQVLSFITSQLIPQPISELNSPSQSTSSTLLLSDFEDVTKDFKATMPGGTLHDAFLQKLWAINNLHALHEFFRELSKVLMRTRAQVQADSKTVEVAKDKILISRVSPLGVFVRRAQLEFVRLQFDDSMKLWVSFTKFREASETQWEKQRPSASMSDLDSNLHALNLGPDSRLVQVIYPNLNDGSDYEPELSTEEMERLLDFQVEKLQRMRYM